MTFQVTEEFGIKQSSTGWIYFKNIEVKNEKTNEITPGQKILGHTFDMQSAYASLIKYLPNHVDTPEELLTILNKIEKLLTVTVTSNSKTNEE